MKDILYKKSGLLIKILIIIIFGFICYKNIPLEFVDLGGDSAQYIILSEAMAQGSGYRNINYPGEPYATHYPPVFSMLLLPVVFFMGRNFLSMHFVIALLGFCSLWFIYSLLKKYASLKLAFFITIFFLLNGIFIHYSTQRILSDIPYLFFSMITLYVGDKFLREDKVLSKKGVFLLIGLLLSYFCRYVGVFLFSGIILTFLLKKDYKKTGFLSTFFLLGFFIWNVFAVLNKTDNSSHAKIFFLINNYAPSFGTLWEKPLYFIVRFVDGVNYYASIISRSMFPYMIGKWKVLDGIFSSASLGLVFLGFWIKFKENKNCIFHYYFFLYFILLIMANHNIFGEGDRYILPVLPFVFFYFFSALKKIFRFIPKKAGVCILCFILILNVKAIAFRRPAINDIGQAGKNFILMHHWMNENISDEGIVFSRKPTVTFFYTKNQSVVYPFTSDNNEIWSNIQKNDVKYIILDEFSRETYLYLRPFVNKYKDRFIVRKIMGSSALLEIIKD